ncbi:MAG: site-specific integrase [Nocardioidaceae bacterium]|nr:site-specific integrase [Nocardioidaceae bacterium]
MASVEKRTRDGRVTWQARWRDPDGRQRKRSFVKRSDADRCVTGAEHSKLVGTYVDPDRSRVTVDVWAAQWLGGQVHLKESTRVRYDGLLRRYVLPRWGTVPLAKIGHADVARWVGELSASGLSASSVRHAHRVLSLLLALAVRDGRLSRNPADGVRLPRISSPPKRFLTHQQVADLADAAGEYGLAVRVLAYCGLRYGEMIALRTARVDLMRRRLEIIESATEVAGRAVFGTPKSHQCRSVPIPRGIADDLAVHVAGKAPDALVFTAPGGGLLRLTNFRRRHFDRAARAVGLDGLTPHELRHTAASLAVGAGANVKSVQRMLGHGSAAMTLDVYAGLFDDDLDAVAERLDAATADARVPRSCPEATVTAITQRETGS